MNPMLEEGEVNILGIDSEDEDLALGPRPNVQETQQVEEEQVSRSLVELLRLWALKCQPSNV